MTSTRHHRSDPSRRCVTFWLGVVFLLVIPGPALAHGPDPILGGARFTQNEVLSFRWRSGYEPPTAMRTAIRAAATDVGESRASQAATFVYGTTGASTIGYGTGTCGVNGIGCFTRTAPDTFTMWLREHGRVYDWGALRWCQMQSTPTNGCYDAETIALDEFGHVEILDHHANYANDSDYTDAVVQTFSRTRPATGWNMHVFGPCDTATLQVQYDVSLVSSPISSCLDLVTALTLSASSTLVGDGGVVTFTSTLRAATNTAYGRLSAQWLAMRSVRLQQRLGGATTWSTIATMTPSSSSATYRVSIALHAVADYRAVFSTPSTEGLRGDTSPTVQVLVMPCTTICQLATEAGPGGP
jgi:hypothetical protein